MQIFVISIIIHHITSTFPEPSIFCKTLERWTEPIHWHSLVLFSITNYSRSLLVSCKTMHNQFVHYMLATDNSCQVIIFTGTSFLMHITTNRDLQHVLCAKLRCVQCTAMWRVRRVSCVRSV